MLNEVNLMGRLTATPELKSTPSGVSNVTFTIAVDRDYMIDGERPTDFITIVAWRSTAEFICRNFSKGKLIAVVGSIETRNWTANDGTKRYATEVIADKVYFAGDKKEAGEPTSNDAPVNTESPDFSNSNSVMDDDLPF